MIACNLGVVYTNLGNFGRAETLFQRSLKILEAKLGPDHPDVATVLNCLARLYHVMGQHPQAEPLYRRGLKIREAKLGPDHPDVADSLNNLAMLYFHMGQYAQAEPLFQRSLKILEAKLGPDHRDVAGSLNNLASLYASMAQYAQAEPLYRRSLKIKEAKLGPDHPDVATNLNNLANLYTSMAQYAQAEPLYRRSLKIYEAKLGPEHPDVATSLNNLAILYFSMGRYGNAEPLYLRSLKIYEAKLGPEHPHVATSLKNLAVLYAAKNDDQQAAAQADRMRRVVRKHVARVLPALGARGQLDFIQRTDEASFHAALSIGWRRPANTALAEQSAAWLVNGKAVVQQSLAEQARLARDSQDARLAEQVKRLSAVRGELAGISQTLPNDGSEAAYRARLVELGDEEQELSRQVNLAAGRPALDEPWIEAATVRKALVDDAVLVELVEFRPCIFEAKRGENCWEPARYTAWVIPPARQGNVSIIDLGEAEKIDASVAAAREAVERSARAIQQPADDEDDAAQAANEALSDLAELVLAPLLPAIGEARKVILSPDAQLWLVPWAALPAAEGEYAIERWQIRYVTSGREVVLEQLADQAKRYSPSRPRIFADPDYNLDGKASAAATRAVLRGKETQLAVRGAAGLSQSGLAQVERLPATADEARLITSPLTALAHEAPTVYSQQYALEGVLKMVQSPRVLVLSTHGFYLPDQEAKKDDDRMMLAGADSKRSRGALLATDGTPLENPLLRCGLLLAGCNQRQKGAAVDDGIVTGMEIVGCDLRGTELVVLSACETGLGEVHNGEGVAGLRQAFQLAGAKAVVSTLWRIPDKETVALMSAFFNNLAAGRSKAEALRAAQLAQIKARRRANGAAHPYYWAAFTVTGN